MNRELEICVETLEGCIAAAEGGADRVELCAALSEGGVTPSRGLIREAVAAISLPIHVLVRPRGGNFVYSGAEVRAMCIDAEDALAEGAAGIVAGALSETNEVDRETVATLIRVAEKHSVTFHRAFDHVADPSASLEALTQLGCSRVLTSGGKPTVTDGLPQLQRLAAQAAGRIRVAAGGGVTLRNASQFVAVDGLDLHASLRPKVMTAAGADPLWHATPAGPTATDVRELAGIVHGERTSR